MAEKGIRVQIYGDYNDKDIRRAMRDLKGLQTAGSGVGGKLQEIGGRVRNFGQGLVSAGGALTKGLTLPIVGLGTAAVLAGANFEKSMNKVRAVSGVTGVEFEKLRDMAKELGRTTQFSASEAADGMTFLAMAGYDTNAILQALPATLDLAAAGELQLAEAADIASNVLGGFRFETDQTNRVIDVMAQVARNANTSVRQMGEAMSYAAPLAATAGISVEAAAAFIGQLGNAGIQGSRAGTTLVGVIGALENATPKAAARLKALGVTTHNAAGELLPLNEIVDQLGKSSITAGDYLTIFGKRAGPGMAAVVGLGTAGLTDLEQKAIDAGGAAKEMAETQLEGLRGQLVKLRSAFEGLMIAIAESGLLDRVTQFFEKLTQKVSDLVSVIDKMNPRTKDMILIFAGIAAALGPVLLIVGKLTMALGSLIILLGKITVAGTLLTIKFVAIIAVIVAVVLAFKAMWDNSEALRTAIMRLIDTAKNIARVLLSDVLGAFRSITGAGGDAGNMFSKIAQIAGNILAKAVNTLISWFNMLANTVRAIIKVFEIAFKIIQMVATLIRGVFIAAIDILLNKLGPVSTALRTVANALRNSFMQIVNAVRNAITSAGQYLGKFINGVIDLVNVMIRAYNSLAGIIPGVTRITEIATFQFKNMAAAGREAATVNSDLAGSVRDSHRAYADFGMAAAGPVSSAISGLTDGTEDLNAGLTDLEDKVKKAGGGSKKASEDLNKFKEKFNEVANTLKARSKEIQDAYNNVVKSVQDAVMGAFDVGDIDPDRIGENGEKVGGTWLDGLASQAAKAVEFANKVAEVVKLGLEPGSAAFDMVMQVTKQQGEGLLDELIAGGVDAVNRSVDIVNSVTGAAKRVGTDAAEQFYGTGLRLAQQTEEAFTKRFGKGGPGYGKLNRLMDALANSLNRTSTITVVTRHVSEGIPGRRFGGPVAAGSPYIVGEAGPELFVPTVTGRIIPNHDIAGSMTGAPRAAGIGGAGTTINLTVNAGMGSDGAEVGRAIVDAIASFERRNGPVYVKT